LNAFEGVMGRFIATAFAALSLVGLAPMIRVDFNAEVPGAKPFRHQSGQRQFRP
jgi:hypothetical protein